MSTTRVGRVTLMIWAASALLTPAQPDGAPVDERSSVNARNHAVLGSLQCSSRGCRVSGARSKSRPSSAP